MKKRIPWKIPWTIAVLIGYVVIFPPKGADEWRGVAFLVLYVTTIWGVVFGIIYIIRRMRS